MDAFWGGSQMKLSLLRLALLLLISLPVVMADVDYTNKEQVNNLAPPDLALAIEQGNVLDMSIIDDGKLAQALNNNPSITYKLADEDLARALRSDISLLQGLNPINPIFTDLTFRVTKNPAILNNNVEVKKEWFRHFQIQDEGVIIDSFDGKQITTRGAKAGTYSILDFPGAQALADGSLVFEGKTFIGTTKLSRVVRDGVSHIEMISGIIETTPDVLQTEPALIKVSEGGDIKITNKDKSVVTYSGDFSLRTTSEGIEIKSTPGEQLLRELHDPEERYSNTLIIGTILQPKNSKYGEFVVVGSADIFPESGETTAVKIRMPEGERTYYTEMPMRGAGKFCGSHPCIINTPKSDYDGYYKARLAISGVPEGGTIEVKSTSYYSNVEFERIAGEASFVSLDQKRKEKSTITVTKETIGVQGVLDNTNAGRVDIVKNDASCPTKPCPEKLYHWSSDQYQKDDVRRYFEKPNSQFVSCSRGVDCMETMAHNFGKVVGPADQPISTVVIIGGDNANLAQSFENGHCKRNRCAIINSRDVPPELDPSVTSLVVTGHHAPLDVSIWRDTPEALPSGHNPIDRLYFNRVPKGSLYDSLPDAKNVESLTFSSCNSVTVDRLGTMYDGATSLTQRYKPIRLIQGWNGKAPYQESLQGPVMNINEIPAAARQSFNRGGLSGQRSWYYFDDVKKKWFFWNGEDQPIELNSKQT